MTVNIQIINIYVAKLHPYRTIIILLTAGLVSQFAFNARKLTECYYRSNDKNFVSL